MSSFFTCTTTREFTFRRIFSLTSQCQCSPFCSPAPSRRDRAPQAQQQHQAFYPRSSPDRERINSEKNQENILKVSQYLFQQLVLGSKVEHKLLVSLLSLRARLGVKETFPAFITLYCSPAGGTSICRSSPSGPWAATCQVPDPLRWAVSYTHLTLPTTVSV